MGTPMPSGSDCPQPCRIPAPRQIDPDHGDAHHDYSGRHRTSCKLVDRVRELEERGQSIRHVLRQISIGSRRRAVAAVGDSASPAASKWASALTSDTPSELAAAAHAAS